MQLVILHYHFRTGGVRRVIELGTAALSSALGSSLREVVLLGGEAPASSWLRMLREQIRPAKVHHHVDSSLGYLAEQTASLPLIRSRLRSFFDLLAGRIDVSNCLVWAHNLGLGRNLLLSRELTQFCKRSNVRLLLHHHDWWFDHRWSRWSEMKKSGYRSIQEVAKILLPNQPFIRHATINHRDFRILNRHFRGRVGWLPNPSSPGSPPSLARQRQATRWIQKSLDQGPGPIWLLPCRMLRRKNVCEALLLTRWLRPEAWLITTAGVSSADESRYAEQLALAAQKSGWRLRLSLLEHAGERAPSVRELMAASEAILLTSIQEGFGLPYLEAAAAQRPLICRTLPNVAPDLDRLGFRFPQAYQDILIDAHLFDWSREQARQKEHFENWQAALPKQVHSLVHSPAWLSRATAPSCLPFSRLTLEAQLEVLSQPVAQSWRRCAPLNPFLSTWRRRAAEGRLQSPPWPIQAGRQLSGAAYAERLLHLAETASPPAAPASPLGPRNVVDSIDSQRCQNQFIRTVSRPDSMFPLLWTR